MPIGNFSVMFPNDSTFLTCLGYVERRVKPSDSNEVFHTRQRIIIHEQDDSLRERTIETIELHCVEYTP